MLVKFTFKNYKSFYEEQTLSLEAGPDDLMPSNITPVDRALLPQSAGLLRTAAVFGTLSSGKTNVLKALDYMKRVVLMSASRVRIVSQCEPFAFIEGAGSMDSHFDIEFIENGTFYRYGFVIRNQKIVKEWLFRRNERMTPLFKRDEYALKVAGLSRNNARLLSPSPQTLFLTTAGFLNLDFNKEIGDVMNWFTKLTVCLAPSQEDLFIYTQKDDYLPEAVKIMQKADIGIDYASLIHNPGYADIETAHKVYDADGNVIKVLKARLFQDSHLYSEGCTRLFCHLAHIVKALDTGGTLFINDFPSMLSVFFTSGLLSLFSSSARNPHGSQFVITGNISPLVDKAFRRDQIYLSTRDAACQSHLIRLSSIPGVRKTDCYEKKLIESSGATRHRLG